MCRPLCDGGRRCTSSKGEHRRAGDRARYAASKAAALPLTTAAPAAGGGAPEPVDEWELAKDRIAELTVLIRADLDEAERRRTGRWADERDARRDELVAQGLGRAELVEALDAEFGLPSGGFAEMAAAEEKVREVGALVDAEVLARVGPPPAQPTMEEKAAAEAAYQAALTAQREARQRFLDAQLANAPEPELLELNDAWHAASEAAVAAQTAMRASLQTDPGATWRLAQGEAARQVLAELRSLGDPDGIHGFHEASQRPAMAAVRTAFDSYPTDWVARSAAADPPVFARHSRGRAHYAHQRSKAITETAKAEPQKRTVRARTPEELAERLADYKVGEKTDVWARGRFAKRKVLSVTVDEDDLSFTVEIEGGRVTTARTYTSASELTTDKSERVTIHEVAHRMEHTNPDVLALESAFYRRRVTGDDGEIEPTTSYMGSRRERVRSDGFVDPYIGKEYGDPPRAFEVLSVGMESVFAGSMGGLLGVDHRASDLDHRAFVLGLLAAV